MDHENVMARGEISLGGSKEDKADGPSRCTHIAHPLERYDWQKCNGCKTNINIFTKTVIGVITVLKLQRGGVGN